MRQAEGPAVEVSEEVLQALLKRVSRPVVTA